MLRIPITHGQYHFDSCMCYLGLKRSTSAHLYRMQPKDMRPLYAQDKYTSRPKSGLINYRVDQDKRYKTKREKKWQGGSWNLEFWRELYLYRLFDAVVKPKMLILHYRFSTSSKCIARYARTTNAAPKAARPMQSRHKAWTLKPKELRMAEPGTSMSRPYLWSTRLRYLTSLTMRPSKA